MSEMFMPPAGAAPPPGGPPGANPLVAAMGAGPGGADTAGLPPELMAALGGGQAPPPGAEGEMEPASLDAALEHIRMGLQMLQELQVASTDDMEMDELGGMMAPLTKMLAGRQKNEQMTAAAGPKARVA